MTAQLIQRQFFFKKNLKCRILDVLKSSFDSRLSYIFGSTLFPMDELKTQWNLLSFQFFPLQVIATWNLITKEHIFRTYHTKVGIKTNLKDIRNKKTGGLLSRSTQPPLFRQRRLSYKTINSLSMLCRSIIFTSKYDAQRIYVYHLYVFYNFIHNFLFRLTQTVASVWRHKNTYIQKAHLPAHNTTHRTQYFLFKSVVLCDVLLVSNKKTFLTMREIVYCIFLLFRS